MTCVLPMVSVFCGLLDGLTLKGVSRSKSRNTVV